MKTRIKHSLTRMLLPMLLIASFCKAQLPVVKPAPASYTYKIFQAPSKNYGYDILLNGKLVYHECASMQQQDGRAQTKNLNNLRLNNANTNLNIKEFGSLSKKDQAEKAALLAIEKIKRREPPVLSDDEVRKITAQ